LASRFDFLHRYKVAFLLVVGLALVLRLIHLYEVSDTPFFQELHTDPFMYHHWAIEIAQGDWLGGSRPVFYLGPLYPYSLALVYSVFGPSTLAACVVQTVLSALSAGLVYHLGRRLFNPATGLIAGLCAAFYGMFIFYSSLILGATLIIFLDLLMLVLLVSGLHRPAWWKWALAGLCFGLVACARGNVVLFGPVAILAIMVGFGFRCWKKWLSGSLWLTLAFFAAISPMTLHNWFVGDDLVPLTSNAGANFFIGNNAHSDGLYMRSARYKGRPMGLSVRDQHANFPEVAREELGRDDLKPSEISSFWVGKAFEEIGSDLGRWLALEGNKLKYILNAYELPNNRNYYFSKRFSVLLQLPLMTYGVLLPLAVAGMVISWQRWREHAVLLAFFIAQVAGLLAFFVLARYRLVVVPVLLVYAAAVIPWVYGELNIRRYWRVGVLAALLAVGYGVVYHRVPHTSYRANFTNLANAYRDLGRPEEALKNYDRTIKRWPDYYYAYLKKGEVLANMGRKDEAREAFDKALSLARKSQDTVHIRRIEARLRKLNGT
jgi:4-amino-4-deoxy-L-arabinose transferase-like glycosyltransferase